MEAHKATRMVIIIMNLYKYDTIVMHIPQEYRSAESCLINIVSGMKDILEIFEDELEILLNDDIIEFDGGEDDPNMHYELKVYKMTDSGRERLKAIAAKINAEQKKKKAAP